MIDKTIFRQYDIRGLVPTQLDFEKAKQIGYFLGIRLKKEINEDLYIVIGYDIRTHSKELFNGLVSGLNKSSCHILDIGLVATGVNYFASYQEYKIDDKKIKPHASIMITGSHNDKKYNGFKITFKN
jgi:phosphomannomutase/phosphoglucomutase